MPQRQGQEGRRHGDAVVEVQPEQRDQERAQDRGRQDPAQNAGKPPASAVHDRLFGIARRVAQHGFAAGPEAERQRRKNAGHHVRIEDLQGQERRCQPGGDRKAHDRQLADVARQHVDGEVADVAEDPAPLAQLGDDRGKAVIPQNHPDGFLCHLGAPLAHGDADIGLLQRGRVVHAVAGHGHDMPGLLKQRDECQLGLGRDAGEDIRAHHLGQPLFVEIVRLDPGKRASFHHRQIAISKPRVAGDGFGGVGMVAREHHDPDTGGPAGRDGVRHVLAHRVEKADQPDQLQLAVGIRVRLRDPLHGERQKAQPVLRGSDVAVEPARAILVRQRLRRAVCGHHLRADLQNRLGRALDGDEEPVAILVNGGHHLPLGVEGVLAPLRQVVQQILARP